MFCRSVVLKPLNSTRTLYAPGVRFGALYAPDSSVVRGREVPLWTSKIVTVAPVIAPPFTSVTVPTMRPALPCENAGRHSRKIPSTAPKTCRAFWPMLDSTAKLLTEFDEFITPHPSPKDSRVQIHAFHFFLPMVVKKPPTITKAHVFH